MMFWASVLSGTCGHTYGANGIWQVNLPGKPYGPSPHGKAWGDTTWQEAADLPASRQLGAAAKLLRTLPWAPHDTASRVGSSAVDRAGLRPAMPPESQASCGSSIRLRCGTP